MAAATTPQAVRRPFLVPGLTYRPGDRLAGKYRLVSLVRRGHACAHLTAIELARNANVSIQLFVPPARANAQDIESARFRFLSAATRSTALKSPHVARVLDAGLSSENLPFIVREELPPKTLADLLASRGGSLPTNVSVAIALDVCAALVEAHARGVLHGELSPASVHIVEDPKRPSVKLTDLGSAHALAALPESERGVRGGTPGSRGDVVRAPELASSNALDARADIWGLGVLLYTMLAGGAPDPEEPESLAGVPDGLAEIVESCLAKDPTKRPRMVSSLAASLAPYAAVAIESAPSLARGLAEIGASTPDLDVHVDDEPRPGPDDTAPQDAKVRDELLALLAQTSAYSATKLPDTIRAIRTKKVGEPTPPAGVPTFPASPVRMQIAPMPPRPRWKMPAAIAITIAAAAAFLVVFESPRIASALHREPASAAVTAAAATAKAPEPEPSIAVTSTTRPDSTSVDALPAATAAAAHPATTTAREKAHARTRASAETKPAEIPAAREPERSDVDRAPPPPKPEPVQEKKTDDDDLRRFIDDRR